MAISRRDLILGAGVAGASLTGCARVATEYRRRTHDFAFAEPKVSEDEKFLNRVTFGWSTEEQKTLSALGRQEYINRQLKADFEEPIELTLQVQSLDCVRMQSVELMEIPKGRVIEQLQCAAILRATYSPNQLRERLVDFWSNHFNIYSGKADGAFFKGNEEEQIIRKHALGSFPEMLKAIAHSPSMLVYLDNQLNVKGHPNENFARELLELHSLGIDGGYSQKDIQEVARCLTGWRMEDRRFKLKGSFRFDPSQHDEGMKRVLGTVIPPNGGKRDGALVLDLLVEHPATAKHLAKKLVTHLTGSRNEALEQIVVEKYRSSKGNIAEMVRPIVESEALMSGTPRLRRPFDFLVASLRRTNALTDGGVALQRELAKMGQLLYDWPLPDGYPVDQISWATNMLPRWQFGYDLTHGKVKNTSIPGSVLAQRNPSQLARILATPDFQVI
jgi:uncharacterized protein (DUF1800 family)